MARLTLSDAKFTRLRAAFAGSYGATADVQRKTLTPDRSGGFNEVWATVHTYPCSFSLYPIRPVERESDVRVQNITTWMFDFPFGSDVRATDRLIVGTRTFEVSGLAEGSWSLSLKVIAQEIL